MAKAFVLDDLDSLSYMPPPRTPRDLLVRCSSDLPGAVAVLRLFKCHFVVLRVDQHDTVTFRVDGLCDALTLWLALDGLWHQHAPNVLQPLVSQLRTALHMT